MRRVALLATLAALAVAGQAADASASVDTRPRVASARATSIANAYQFLNQMMDLYATGSVPRLVQSFAGGVLAQQHFTDSVTYDDAAIVDAYLAEGTPEGLSRAETIGNALLYVQANDPAHDGRIRPAYAPYSMFNLLAHATGDPVWSTRAAWAQRFVRAMWNPSEGRFYVGTTNNGKRPEGSALPEDVNSWSYLALAEPAFAGSLDWDVSNLAVSAEGFSGVSFCAGDRSGVWFEGTAHLADALELRGQPGDQAQAETYLSDIEYAQTNGLNNDGLGIVAASKDGLGTCEGEAYFSSLHTGATAWYLLAAAHVDPFLS